ncbi:MAG: hypothetical protein KF685_04565 [Acidobacteria bacterium]|nr:hypothetical protein [Acidobacteriota bacterium]
MIRSLRHTSRIYTGSKAGINMRPGMAWNMFVCSGLDQSQFEAKPNGLVRLERKI